MPLDCPPERTPLRPGVLLNGQIRSKGLGNRANAAARKLLCTLCGEPETNGHQAGQQMLGCRAAGRLSRRLEGTLLVNLLKEAPLAPHDSRASEAPEWAGTDAARLINYRVAGNPDFVAALADLCAVLEVDGIAIWGALAESIGMRPVFAYSHRPSPPADAGTDDWNPQIWRSNGSSVDSADDGAHLERLARHFRPDGFEFTHELKVLERGWKPLLAWCGIFRNEPFTSRQTRLFQLLGPALRRRVIFEYELLRSATATAFLTATLDAVDAPSFLVDQEGYVLRFNAAGENLVRSSAAQIAGDLASALKGNCRRYVVTKMFPSSASLLHYALVRMAPMDDLFSRLAIATEKWELTHRQSEVLSRLALGESNKSIAAYFHCAENTVELHVTRLLRRTGVESRTALVAAFWRMPLPCPH